MLTHPHRPAYLFPDQASNNRHPALADIQPLPSSPIITKLNLMNNNTDLHLPDLPTPSPYIRSLVTDFGLKDPPSLIHLYADTIFGSR